MKREMNTGLWAGLRDLLGLNRAAEEDPALRRAYARFHATYPQWTSSLFDWHFITHHVLPIITGSSRGFSDTNAARVARAWAEQWNLGHDVQNRAARRAMSATRGFFTLLEAEIARLPDDRFADSIWQPARPASLHGQSARLEPCSGNYECKGR